MSTASNKSGDAGKKTSADKARKRTKAATAKAAAKTRTPRVKPVAVPELELHNLKPRRGATKTRLRVGRGPGSGRGKTSGRGHKGQKSRSGYSMRRGFEGGQMPLYRRVPKRGFTNVFRKEYSEVNLSRLAEFSDKKKITPELLLQQGVIKKVKDGVKILGHGEINKAYTIRAHAFSASAKKKIEAAGGKIEVVTK